MTLADDEAPDRAREVLAAWFESGGEAGGADLESLCGGDAALVQAVRELVAGAPRIMDLVASLPGESSSPPIEREQVGEFRLVGPIGEGGMGRVFLAIQESLGRPVALKVLDRSRLGDPKAGQRFRREAAIAAQLDHPNIVPIYGLGEDDGCAWIAMKWLTGPGLDALAAPLEPDRAAAIGAAIARALHQAHLAGIVHRDIKPANIILDEDKPYLVDFGLARSGGDATLTQPGVVPGTLPYMAPEQLRGGTPVLDPRIDIYSLGATLYEAVSGRPPFPEEEPERLIAAILRAEPARLRLQGAHRDLETIILRALDKEPVRRFATAAEMAEDLDRLLRGEPIRSRPSGVATRAWKLVRRHRLPAAAVAAAVVVSLGFLALFLVRVGTDARMLHDRRRAVVASLAAEAYDEARILSREILREHPADAETLEMLRVVEAEEALEALLDQVQDRAAAFDAGAIGRLAGKVLETQGAGRHPRTAMLALAVADLAAGRAGDAVRRVDAIESAARPAGGPGRDTKALRAAASTERPIVLEEDEEPSAERHVMAALALRAGGAPIEQQFDEVARASRLEPEDPRTKLVTAVLHADAGHDDFARGLFLGMPVERRSATLIRRNRARLLLIAGQPAAAERELAELRPEEHNALTRILETDVLRRSGRVAEARRRFSELAREHSDDPEVLLKAAAWDLEDGNVPAALARFEQARARAVRAPVKELAEASLLGLRLGEVVGTHDPAGSVVIEGDLRSDVKEIEEAALELAAQVGHPPARACALAAQAWARRLRGDLHGAIRLLEQAVEADPGHSSHRSNLLAFLVEAAASGPPPTGPADVAARAEVLVKAAAEARRIIEQEGQGVAPSLARQVDEAVYARAAIDWLRGDREALDRDARTAIERFTTNGNAARLADVERLLR